MAETWIDSEEEFPRIDGDDDRVYEEIEAPKFVDFSAPEKFLPYDASWFCKRIGCDQNHEEIDPDTVYKNFVLRVMAARSPNVRFHKSLCQQVGRCPKTEPVKCVNEHRLRFAEKMNNARLKAHPISSLRSTPAKAKTQPLEGVKDMATPRSRVRPSRKTILDNATISSKNKKLGNSLVICSPKKVQNSASSTTHSAPKSRLCCSALRKLQTESQVKSSKRQKDGFNNRKPALADTESNISMENPVPSSDMRAENNEKAYERYEEQSDPEPKRNSHAVLSSMSNFESNGFNRNFSASKEQIADSMVNENAPDNSLNDNDDKENAPAIYQDRDHISKTANVENCDRSSQKATGTPGKCLHENSSKGLKYKKMKPTNPKPFRFRTDERGILKEANLEKRAPQDPLKEVKQTTTPKSKKLQQSENIIEILHLKSGSNKPNLPLFHSQSCSSYTVDGKSSAEGSKTRRILNRKKEEQAGSTMLSRVRMPNTIPKEPNFQKMHVPKNCTKKPTRPIIT